MGIVDPSSICAVAAPIIPAVDICRQLSTDYAAPAIFGLGEIAPVCPLEKKTCTKGKTRKWYNNGPDVEISKNRQDYVDLTENLHDQPVKKNHPIDPNPAGNLTRDQRADSIAATW